jgi:lipoate-protein ligase A
MIERCTCLRAPGTDPYENLAREEALLGALRPGECILYLWQNADTVVVGRNQNCWKECRVAALEADGGHLARRLSGGGAVFHDLGNLNYTFLAQRADYDVARQTEVILGAVRALGVPAERTGRNDLTAGGRKFSGNAYCLTRTGCYQHGTLLVRADGGRIGRYLTVSREKLAAKGVDSVRARVCSLTEFVPGLTVSALADALEAAFSAACGVPAQPLAPGRIPPGALAALREKYASPAWKYGRSLPFTYAPARRFAWGELQLQLVVAQGRIADCGVYTDALDTEFPARLGRALTGCLFSPADVSAALEAHAAACPADAAFCADARALLLDAM